MAANDGVVGNFSVTITQAGATLAADGTETILDIAQRNDVDYPCGCESGVCGACKSMLRQGDVEMLPHSVLALSPAERKRGMVLACRALPRSDLEIAWLDSDDPPPPQPRQRMITRVVSIDRMTHDIVRIRLEQPERHPFLFTPGQSANLHAGGNPSRPYSMASQPDDPYIEFHVRKVPGGRLSTYVVDRLALSELVEIEGPFGASYLREKHMGPIIGLAGGSGLAPVISVLTAGLRRCPERPAVLLHGVRDGADVYLEAELAELVSKYPTLRTAVVLSNHEGTASTRIAGFLADVLEQFALPTLDARAYLAGPPVMVETCIARLQTMGMERKDCHADAFVQATIESSPGVVAPIIG